MEGIQEVRKEDKNKVLHGQSRQTVYNMYRYTEEKKENKGGEVMPKNIQNKVAEPQKYKKTLKIILKD